MCSSIINIGVKWSCMIITCYSSRVWINRVSLKVANPTCGQLNRENKFSLFPFSPDNLVSRDRFGRRVPRQPAHYPLRLNLLILIVLTHRIPRGFRGGVHSFIYTAIHTPSGQSRVSRVTQLCTDDVHCQESAGTRPVVLKVV